MVSSYRDWVVETSSTTGTGAYALSGAAPAGTSYFTFRQRYSNGHNRVVYWAVNSDRTKWEKNQFGTLTYGTPDTLSRNVIESTNGDAPVPWVGGDLPLRLYVAQDSDAVDSMSTIVRQMFTSSGTYTPNVKMIAGYVVAKGGGGGGGGTNVIATVDYGMGGGSEGNTVIKYFTRDDVIPTVAVTVGGGGTGQSGGTSGTAGGDTTFGSLATAKGGLPANPYTGLPNVATGCVGDVIILGATGTGGSPIQATTDGNRVCVGGNGGGGGGGAGAVVSSNGTSAIGGNAVSNTGGGGGGGVSKASGPGPIAGGAGSFGFLYVVEFLRK